MKTTIDFHPQTANLKKSALLESLANQVRFASRVSPAVGSKLQMKAQRILDGLPTKIGNSYLCLIGGVDQSAQIAKADEFEKTMLI